MMPNKLTKALFFTYLGILIWILIFKMGVQFSYMAERRVNLIPFNMIDYIELILNVLIFVLSGIFLGILFKGGVLKNILSILFTSFAIEILQFILKIGSIDITDLITNTTGGIVGIIIFKIIEKLFSNKLKAQKFINIIAAIVIFFY